MVQFFRVLRSRETRWIMAAVFAVATIFTLYLRMSVATVTPNDPIAAEFLRWQTDNAPIVWALVVGPPFILALAVGFLRVIYLCASEDRLRVLGLAALFIAAVIWSTFFFPFPKPINDYVLAGHQNVGDALNLGVDAVMAIFIAAGCAFILKAHETQQH